MVHDFRRGFLCALVLCAFVPTAVAIDLSNSITGSVTDGSRTLPYRLFHPADVDTSEKLPLILFLHGRGNQGTDNIQQTEWMGGIIKNTQGGRFSSYVLAPQIGTDQWFQSFTDQPTQAMSLTIQAVKKVMAEESIDPSRVYVTGLSMGGMGTWDILAREPRMFAAAVPMSGGGDVRTASLIKDIPIWAFHGDADSIVPVDATRNMINALFAEGASPNYTELAGEDHVIWGPLYDDKDHTLYPWLFSQRLANTAGDPWSGAITNSGVPEAFSMTPVPEPGALSLLVVGAAFFLRRNRA